MKKIGGSLTAQFIPIYLEQIGIEQFTTWAVVDTAPFTKYLGSPAGSCERGSGCCPGRDRL